MARLPFEAVVSEATDTPLYQRIAPEVRQLRGLGLCISRIAEHLHVSDKTAAKALAWVDEK